MRVRLLNEWVVVFVAVIFQETIDGIFLNVRFTLADDDEEKTCDRDLEANVRRRQASIVTYEKKSPAEAEIHGSEEPNFVEESKNNTAHHCHLAIVSGQKLRARLHNDRSVLNTPAPSLSEASSVDLRS